MLPSSHWVVLVVLGACTPTLIVPIQSWHHHAATPADGERGGDPGSPHDCSLCALAPAIVAELPVGLELADPRPALAAGDAPTIITHTRSAPVACARAPPSSLLPAV